jgi:predicted lipid carrier protein YhbT
MATQQECEVALGQLASQFGGDAAAQRDFDRSLSCHVPDLGITFSGRLRGGRVESVTAEPAPKAQIRFTASSDDLVALAEGRLGFAPAWSSKRLKVEAGFMDLLKLRSML